MSGNYRDKVISYWCGVGSDSHFTSILPLKGNGRDKVNFQWVYTFSITRVGLDLTMDSYMISSTYEDL